jgi:putative phage-type endonuclease
MSDEIQRSDEWFAARCGKATASAIHKIIAKTKTGWGADRANYEAQLIVERLTGKPTEGYTNTAMQWGIDNETQARAVYELESGNDVKEVGFIPHPSIADSGASPDGLIGNDGCLEIKCPNSATHLDFVLFKTIDKKYICQTQWQMACTGRKWCDFVSFDPRFPLNLQMMCVRVNRDPLFIAELEKEVVIFLGEVRKKMIALVGEQIIEADNPLDAG